MKNLGLLYGCCMLWALLLSEHPCTSFATGHRAKVQQRAQGTKHFANMNDGNGAENGGKNANSSTDEKEAVERLTWNPLRLAVLRLGLTELRFTSPLNYGKYDATFDCAYCGNKLFDADGKYDSGSGWPSFWRSLDEGSISYKREFDGRLECRCQRCNSHLGHVFLDGPRSNDVSKKVLNGSPASDPRSSRQDGRLPRFCVNGASLKVTNK